MKWWCYINTMMVTKDEYISLLGSIFLFYHIFIWKSCFGRNHWNQQAPFSLLITLKRVNTLFPWFQTQIYTRKFNFKNFAINCWSTLLIHILTHKSLSTTYFSFHLSVFLYFFRNWTDSNYAIAWYNSFFTSVNEIYVTLLTFDVFRSSVL